MASFDEAIPPGSAGSIKASVKTEGFRGLTERAITVESNDPDLPRVAIFVRLNARVGVSLLPAASLRLGRGRAAQPETSLLVRRESGIEQALKVEGVETSVPWLRADARVVTADEPGTADRPPARPGDWILRVALGPGAPSGSSVQQVRFRTGLDVEPAVEVPVRVTLPFPVNLSVPNLVLNPGPEGLEGSIVLTVRADLDPAAMELKVDPPYVASLEPAGNERAFRLKVRVPDPSAPPGKVVFRFGSEESVLSVAPALPPRP